MAQLDLFPAQGRALRAQARELLVAAEPSSGGSHLLRVLAVMRAWSAARCSVVLACRDAQAVREDHLDGAGGLWRLLEPWRRRGAVEFGTGGAVRFKNGSVLRLTTWSAAAKVYPDFLFIDDADAVDWPLFSALRERVLSGGPAAAPRLTVVSKRPDSGWVREHWPSIEPDGERIDLRAGDLPELLRARRRAEAEAEAEAPLTFRQHAKLAAPSLLWLRHVEVIAGAIERLFAGDLPEGANRLFVAAPPQSGKSTVARLATSWWLRKNPHLAAGTASYNQDYAFKNSRKIRDYYRASGGVLRGDSWKVGDWELPEGGGLWAVGVGGGTGKPANLLVSDDLVKGTAQAISKKVQEAAIEWREGSWLSRWNPYGGRLIELMIGTRWDLRDVQTSALEEGGWHCVILPGLMPEREIEIPPGNTLEPDWREPGEALCEELPKLRRSDLLLMRDGRGPGRKGAMKPRRFAALIQQQPKPAEGGGIFKDFWFPILPWDPAAIPDRETGLPPGDKIYAEEARCWDLAGTRGGGDATTSVRAGRRADNGRVVMRHALAIREAPEGVKRRIAEWMIRDGPRVTVGIPVDPGQAGKFQIAEMTDYLRRYAAAQGVPPAPVRGMVTTASKVARSKSYADAAEPALENPPGVAEVPGSVDLVRGEWNAEFLEQHLDFDGTEGKADDYVDAAADAYRLVSGSTSRGYLGWRRK